jgi:lipopolysaccharide assembly outer membrane protein LptD (OstA)
MTRVAASVGLCCLLGLGVASAQGGNNAGAFHNVGGFDTITTESIDTNLNTGSFSVPQHFQATRTGTEISADRATGNTKKKSIHAVGHVVVHRTGPIEGQNAATSKLGQEPSTLTCDKLDIDGVKKFYVATGNVHFTQADRDATADRGTLNDTTNDLHLDGNVHVRDKDQFLDASSVVYNTKTGDVHATGTPVMVRAPAATPEPSGAVPFASPSAKPKRKP